MNIRRKLYFVWYQMVRRCNDADSPAYARYGERGISVDPRWLNFNNFFEDMESTYSTGLELDRKDNDGPLLRRKLCLVDPSAESVEHA